MKSKRIQYTTKPQVNCRAVSCLIDMNKGVPVCRNVSDTASHALPTEKAMLGIGLMGSHDGEPFARIGVYEFKGGVPVLRFPLEFDMSCAKPIIRAARDGRQMNEAEKALVNWTQGMLFNLEMQTGAYYLKLDGINGSGSRGIAEDILGAAIRRNFPLRKEFAVPREFDQSVAMVEKFVEQQHGVESHGLIAPEHTALLSLDMVPGGGSNLPVRQTVIERDLFRSLAISRFSSGLNSRSESFQKIRRDFINSLNKADGLTKRNRPQKALFGEMEKDYVALMREGNEHLQAAGEQLKDIARRVSSVTAGLQALKAYYLNRTQDGGVNMLAQTGSSESMPAPLFTMVLGVPLQVNTDYMSSGEFKYHGNEMMIPAQDLVAAQTSFGH